MTTQSSRPDGTVSEDELRYMRRRCKDGYGAAITPCIYVNPDGRALRGVGASSPAHFQSLTKIAAAFHAGGNPAIAQLYDGGRLCPRELVAEHRVRAPSAVASLRPGAVTPREMSDEEIERLIAAFAAAARRTVEAGFDGVELHGANHYIIHQFFSPRANRRRDRWGGTLEARMSFPLTLVNAVRDEIGPRRILGFRISPVEREPGGFTCEEAAELCERLSPMVDYVHLSMNDFRSSRPMNEVREWSLEHEHQKGTQPMDLIAGRLADDGAALMVAGGIGTLEDVREAFTRGASLVAVGRACLIDPEWLSKTRSGDTVHIRRFLPKSIQVAARELTMPVTMVQYVQSRSRWLPVADEP